MEINNANFEENMNVELPPKTKLKKLDEDHYKFSLGEVVYVTITREKDGTWYYVRLNNVSRSYKKHENFADCMAEAYKDMCRAKLD